MALFWFLLLIGPLVFFHELGHFIVARAFGVKCEQFAVGVGPIIASFTRWETEFSIRAFPLGGYVLMLGADMEEPLDDEDKGKALTDKPVWQRMLIYLAGPAANILLALPLFFAWQVSQTLAEGPEIGSVLGGSPADVAGLQVGDRVLSINGEGIATFDQIQKHTASGAGRTLQFEVQRGDETLSMDVRPEPIEALDRYGFRTITKGQVGIMWSRYPSVVHVRTGSPAWNAGLRTFDHVQLIDGEVITAWSEVAERLGNGPADRTLEVSVLRPHPTQDSFGELWTRELVHLSIPASLEGVMSSEATVASLTPGSPAEQAGVRAGDRVVSQNGKHVTSLSVLAHSLMLAGEVPALLGIDRDGTALEIELTPRTLSVTGRATFDRTYVGLNAQSVPHVPYERVPLPVFERIKRALVGAFVQVFELMMTLVGMLAMLFIGRVDASNLGGPLMIAQMASEAGSRGILPFLHMAGLISVNLAILNLAPIPGLDGGNLAVLSVEGILRRPLSLRARQIIGYVGLVCLVLLMLLVFKNDVERYWVDVANWLNS